MSESKSAPTLLPDEALARLPTVLGLTGMQKATWYSRVAKGTAPAPIKLSERSSAWRVGDIRAWLKDPAGWRAPAANDASGVAK